MAIASTGVLNTLSIRLRRAPLRYWLAAAALALFLFALWLHATTSAIPARYTWTFPLQLYGNASHIPGFWSLVSAAVFSGLVARGWITPTWPNHIIEAALYACWPLTAYYDNGFAIVITALAAGLNLYLIARNISVSWHWLYRTAFYSLSITLSLLGSAYVYTVLKAHLFLTRNAQDALIVNLDMMIFGKPTYPWFANLGAQHATFASMLDYIYVFFFAYMLVFLIGTYISGNKARFLRYCTASLLCYLSGALLYFAVPAMGPAFFDPRQFQFIGEQDLVSSVIQLTLRHNMTDLLDGKLELLQTYGFIAAIPSLHVTHTLIICYFGRLTPISSITAIAFFILTTLATLVLGWHYWIDVVLGALLAWPCIIVARKVLPD